MTDSRRPEDRSAYGDAMGELHERALAEASARGAQASDRFMEWFDREAATGRAEPLAPDGAARANADFEDPVPWWRRGAALSLVLGACAVGAVFAIGSSLSGHARTEAAPRAVAPSSEAPRPIAPAVSPSSPGPVTAVVSEGGPVDPCRGAVRAEGRAPQIDDFEDGNELVSLLESRNGYWVIISDSDPAASETVLVPSLLPEPHDGSRSALHVTGGKHTKWGASVQLELGPRCYDASAYRGIAFDVRGPGRLYAGVRMIDAVPVDRGGTCTADCYESNVAPVVSTGSWSHHEILWADLHPRGKAAPANPRRLSGLEFLVRAEDTPYDLWIDDVTFVR